MPDPSAKTQSITSHLSTSDLPATDLPEAPPQDQRQTERRKSAWFRHWLLPVSLGLAIVYWIYLYRTVVREKPVYVDISLQLPINAKRVLYLRPPSDEYTITEVRTADDNKAFSGKVYLRIVAPGQYLANLDSLQLLVDVPPPPTSGAPVEFSFADVKDMNNGQLTPFIREMQPARLRAKVELSTTAQFELTPKRVRIRFPQTGDWQKRVFTDSLSFKPSAITLHGPKVEIDKLYDKEKEIVGLDLVDELPRLEGRSDKALAGGKLELLTEMVQKGVKMTGDPYATIRVAPRPSVHKDYRVPVSVDWIDSPLPAAEFSVDQEAAVEITSYNSELTRLLSDRTTGERWVRANLRCIVNLGRLDPTLDFTAADFQTHLDPDWHCFDRNYELERDLVVVKRSLIAVKRRQT